LKKLDRILSCTEWELKFPHTTVQALTREISDHTLLFLNTGEAASINNQSPFKFELGWLLRDGFFDLAKCATRQYNTLREVASKNQTLAAIFEGMGQKY